MHKKILFCYTNSKGGFFLTNINCSSNCIYQKDGKCSFHFVSPSFISSFSQCVYFIPKNNEDKSNKT